MIRPLSLLRLARAAAQAALDELERSSDRALCRRVGHDGSWTYAASIGVLDRPVCRRCDEPLGR